MQSSVTMSAADLLRAFTQRVCVEDTTGASALFAEDGVYEDLLYGDFRGPAGIRELLTEHFFHYGGEFRWEVFDTLGDENAAYGHYRFGFTSRHADSLGRRVTCSGCARVEARDGRILRYREWADIGAVLVQLGIPDPVIVRMAGRRARLDATPT